MGLLKDLLNISADDLNHQEQELVEAYLSFVTHFHQASLYRIQA